MSSQQLLISYGGSGGLPVGENWWVEGYAFGGSPAQMAMRTAEQGLTGNAIVVGQLPNGYNAILRDDSGGISGPQYEYVIGGLSYAYADCPKMDASGDLFVGVRGRSGSYSITYYNKHDSNGAIIWTKHITVAEVSLERPPAFGIGSSGAMYIFNQPIYALPSGNGHVIKLDASGNWVWTKVSAPIVTNFNPSSIALDSSENVYGCYISYVFTSPNTFYGTTVAKYNSSGTSAWHFQYQFVDRAPLPTYRAQFLGGFSLDEANDALYVSSSGIITVVNEYFLFLLKTNLSGVVQWYKRVYNTLGTYTAVGGLVACSNGVVGIFMSMSVSGFWSYLVRFNSSGDTVACVKVTDNSPNGLNLINARLVSDGNGNLVLSGSLFDPTNTLLGFSSKFPDDLSKTGSWAVGATGMLTFTASTEMYTTAGNGPDTLTSNTYFTGDNYNPVADATGSFTQGSTTVTTTITDIT